MKRYYENKDKVSNQRNLYHEKNRDKLLRQQNDHRNKRSTDFEKLHRSYDESQIKLKASEEKVQNEHV